MCFVCWAAFLPISLLASVFPVSLPLFFLFLRPCLIHARMPGWGRAFVHGHTFLHSWSGPMTLVVGLLHGATILSNLRALSDERFGRCGRKAAWPLRNCFWKRLHWFLRKTLVSCHTSGLAAWPLRWRRMSSLETAAAKPLGYVRRAFFRRRSRSGRQCWLNYSRGQT